MSLWADEGLQGVHTYKKVLPYSFPWLNVWFLCRVCVCTCKRLGDMIHSNNFNIYLMKCFYSCTHKHTLGVFSFFSSSPFVCLFQFLCTVLLALVNIFSHICWSRANIYVLDRCCGIFVAVFFIPQNIIHSYMFTYIHTLSQVEIRLAFDCKCNSSRRQVLLVGWSELSTMYTEKSRTTLFILPPPLPPPPSVVLHFFCARRVSFWWQITIICFLYSFDCQFAVYIIIILSWFFSSPFSPHLMAYFSSLFLLCIVHIIISSRQLLPFSFSITQIHLCLFDFRFHRSTKSVPVLFHVYNIHQRSLGRWENFRCIRSWISCPSSWRIRTLY